MFIYIYIYIYIYIIFILFIFLQQKKLEAAKKEKLRQNEVFRLVFVLFSSDSTTQ